MALTREQVVAEALRLSDEKGLDGLSLRALAGRLDVQAPTLYWHVANKSALLDALSDAIMAEALAAVPIRAEGEDASLWALDAFAALRAAMLGHRDGARIVSGAHDSLRRAEFTELVMAELIGGGADPAQAWLLAMAATRYALGHVLAEQGPDAAPSPAVQEEFQRRFPLVARGVADYFADGTADDLYADALRILLAVRSR